MLGAIFGDIVGSVYEINNTKRTDFPLLSKRSRPTDDSIMSLAVARALMKTWGRSDDEIKAELVRSMQHMGRLYPRAGYGGFFARWLKEKDPRPYNSFGNGSAMRVSSVGWLYHTLEDTLHAAELTAEVTHNHPEGIKGAQAIAAAIYLARNGKSKDEIRRFIEDNYYKLDFTLDEIRPWYEFDVSCQGSCPQAIEAFLEGDSFEDVILKAISIGGDSDTIAAMAGGIAEAFYGIPEDTAEKAMSLLKDTKFPFHEHYSVVAEAVKSFWQWRRNHMLQK